jgi:ferritin-like metal-binding protein YciE
VTFSQRLSDRWWEKPYGSHSAAMQAILTEANSLFQTPLPSVILDAGLIAVLSKALHYQIATYRSLHISSRSTPDEHGLQALAEALEEQIASRGDLVDLAVNHFFASKRNKAFVAG